MPSTFVADYFAAQAGPLPPVHVVPNGVASVVHSAARLPADGTLRLATLGPVIPHKGADIVIDAIALAGIPRVRYLLLGPLTHPYATELRRSADAIPGLELCRYGPYEPADLPSLLADVDVVVAPSRVVETFSIVAREALACGVPVIASRAGGLGEAVRDGDNGFLFEAGDASALAKLLSRVHDEPALLDRLRAGIRADDWIPAEQRVATIERLLREAADPGRTVESPDARLTELEQARSSLGPA